MANTTAGEEQICDLYLKEGWYKFTGPQGNDMPTQSPGIPACGTQYPVWMNGKLAFMCSILFYFVLTVKAVSGIQSNQCYYK